MSRVRITGGEWCSRLIRVADLPGLRPTPDRVRETLFNWLGQDLDGLACLDAFAGSGVLGFEAASRGAARATLVEANQRAFAALRENADLLGGDRLELVRSDAIEFMSLAARQRRAYDLVFLDPPYRQGWLDRIGPRLESIARPGMRVYAEAERELESLGDWHTIRRGRAGQVYYHLLEKE